MSTMSNEQALKALLKKAKVAKPEKLIGKVIKLAGANTEKKSQFLAFCKIEYFIIQKDSTSKKITVLEMGVNLLITDTDETLRIAYFPDEQSWALRRAIQPREIGHHPNSRITISF